MREAKSVVVVGAAAIAKDASHARARMARAGNIGQMENKLLPLCLSVTLSQLTPLQRLPWRQQRQRQS